METGEGSTSGRYGGRKLRGQSKLLTQEEGEVSRGRKSESNGESVNDLCGKSYF